MAANVAPMEAALTPLLWFGYIAATASGLALAGVIAGALWLVWRVVIGWLREGAQPSVRMEGEK